MITWSRLLLTEESLRAAAGERSFERGLRYLRAVSSLNLIGNQIIATVWGSQEYPVVLTMNGDVGSTGCSLRGACGCPYGRQGYFCKHCVAVGLSALAKSRGSAAACDPAAQGAHQRHCGLGPWLTSLSRNELLALVCDQVVEDEDWRCRLELKAAVAAGDLSALGDSALRLLRLEDDGRFAASYGYLEGPEAFRFARRVRDVVAVIRGLTRKGHPVDAMRIAEKAIAAAVESSRNASDEASAIAAAVADLTATHTEARRAAAAEAEDGADPGESGDPGKSGDLGESASRSTAPPRQRRFLGIRDGHR